MDRTTLTGIAIAASTLVLCSNAAANDRDQAKRIYDRLVGTPPSVTMLDTLEDLVSNGQAREAALLATEQNGFYNVTLKNMATPWTNEASDVFEPLNDYTATVIGLTLEDADFRDVLFEDVIYYADPSLIDALPGSYSISTPSGSNNDHYEQLEQQDVPLKEVLVAQPQSSVYSLPATATAGVMTSRAAAKAFFVGGTNRAMLRFTLVNHMCRDLEQVKDITRPSDRIRQDISRSPGGDSRIYLNSCIGCHSGMDPLAQAFAYYDWSGAEGEEGGEIIYTDGAVQGKYLINENNFPHGFITPDDSWDNYWRDGPNANLGWGAGSGSGNGAKSMGQELANSEAFASCQSQKVFKAVCLRTPHSSADVTAVNNMTSDFVSNGHRMRDLFADAAVYCSGE